MTVDQVFLFKMTNAISETTKNTFWSKVGKPLRILYGFYSLRYQPVAISSREKKEEMNLVSTILQVRGNQSSFVIVNIL